MADTSSALLAPLDRQPRLGDLAYNSLKDRLIVDGNLINAGPKTVVVPFLDTRVLDEITTMRFALEGVAAERGAANVTRADIETLEKLQAKINLGLDTSKYSDVL